MKAGELKDGTLVIAVYKLGIDPMDGLTLYLEKASNKIEILMSNGDKQTVRWIKTDENIYNISITVDTLNPIVLFIS